jgi:ATP-dependent Clp protease ATP-binding subunit ClpA
MLELEHSLAKRLAALQVRIHVPDEDTAIFRHVPVHRRFFNKEATNVLIKRNTKGLPFLVCVDEDLEYLGSDKSLARVFASASQQSGWRMLHFIHMASNEFQTAVEDTLIALGTNGQEPSLPIPSPCEPVADDRTLLSVFGSNLTNAARQQEYLTIDREDEIDEIISCLRRWSQTRLIVVAGESGVGKSNLLQAVAKRSLSRYPEWNVISLDLAIFLAGAFFEAEQERLLSQLLDQAAAIPRTVVALEHIELATSLPHGPLMLSGFLDKGYPLVGTILPIYLPKLHQECLIRRLQVIQLAELAADQTLQVVLALRPRVSTHHRIDIDESCVSACVRAAHMLPGYFPAKAIALLDAAASRSSLTGATVLSADEIYAAADRLRDKLESDPC